MRAGSRRMAWPRASGLLVPALLALLGLLSPAAAVPEEMLPPEVQAMLLKKILAYDKALSGAPKIAIGYAKELSGNAQQLRDALQKNELAASLVPLTEVAEKAQGISVLIVLAPAAPAPIRDFCRKSQVLSVSSSGGPAERGEVSVGLGVKEGRKPEIVVHLGQLKEEGHMLSSALLGLARVIR